MWWGPQGWESEGQRKSNKLFHETPAAAAPSEVAARLLWGGERIQQERCSRWAAFTNFPQGLC